MTLTWLNAISNHMVSRDFRNVNREIFVLRLGGFDMHGGSEVSTMAVCESTYPFILCLVVPF